MKAQREPKTLTFEKALISVLTNTMKQNGKNMNSWANYTMQSTLPACDVTNPTGTALIVS